VRPLAGVVVLSLEQAVAVPYATRLLADLGARVIKIERPGEPATGGDFARHYDRACGTVSSYFAWVNAGKESVTLDLKHPRGAEITAELVARADVVTCNLSPAAAARLGLDAATLRASRPELVVAELSGYGEGGPYADRKAYDALVQSEAGLVASTGDGEVTARAGISAADIAAGVQLHAAVLAALLHRERTGLGATLRLTLLESLAEWMHQPLLYALGTGTEPGRHGAHHPTIAPYGPFRCADGASVHLAVQNEAQWLRLCVVTGRPELAVDPRFDSVAARVANRAALHAELAGYLDTVTAAELQAALDAADVPAARTRRVSELRTHPQLTARERWVDVAVPGDTTVAMLRPPVDADAWTARPGNVPELGEHTDRVLTWLGHGPEDIAALRAESVV